MSGGGGEHMPLGSSGPESTSGPEAGGATNGDAESGSAEEVDAEALGSEREEYPDPESYPSPETSDGTTPDADLRLDDPSGGEERHGRA